MVSNNKKRKRDTNKEDQDRPVNKAPKSGGNEKEVLLQEILALGGTEEDLDLVLDAQSDSENEAKPTAKSTDKDFKNEFAKFVAGLGIEGQAPEAEADEEDEEVDDDDWRDEALQSESESSEPEEAPKVPEKNATKAKESSKTPKVAEKPATIQVKESMKDQNRLVCSSLPLF